MKGVYCTWIGGGPHCFTERSEALALAEKHKAETGVLVAVTHEESAESARRLWAEWALA